MKTCYKCCLEKDNNQFYKDSSRKDGFSNICKICDKEHSREYHINHRLVLKDKKARYYEKNKEKFLNYFKNYQKNNQEKLKEYNKKYRILYRPKKRTNESLRRKNDISFKIKENIRTRIKIAIKNNYKSDNTNNLIGCDIDFLKAWLNITALANGYTNFDINNYSGQEYHIDHKIPCASFDLSKQEEQKKCFNWSNMQILTKEKNLIKADKVEN